MILLALLLLSPSAAVRRWAHFIHPAELSGPRWVGAGTLLLGGGVQPAVCRAVPEAITSASGCVGQMTTRGQNAGLEASATNTLARLQQTLCFAYSSMTRSISGSGVKVPFAVSS